MALKLKQYTPTYKGLDFGYYATREAPIILIITNKNTGKTTNGFGWLMKELEKFVILTRWKNEQDLMHSKFNGAKEYYPGNIEYNKKLDAFVDTETNEEMGYILSLSGSNAVKHTAERYREANFIIFDEFLPSDGRYIKESSRPGHEWELLKTIIASVRKGKNGEYTRNVKTILMANLVDAINPYFKNITDSRGDSLLTILSRAYANGQTNFTHDDPLIYMTVHIDDNYEHDDPLSRLLGGGGGVSSEFMRDLSHQVRPITKDIQKQLTKPLIRTGRNALYRVKLRTTLEISGQPVVYDNYSYYWAPSKAPASTMEEIARVDTTRYNHFYSDIVVKAETQDFMRAYNLQTKVRF